MFEERLPGKYSKKTDADRDEPDDDAEYTRSVPISGIHIDRKPIGWDRSDVASAGIPSTGPAGPKAVGYRSQLTNRGYAAPSTMPYTT